ncbi:MAG: glycosyltransferase family 2 protein [bacterium]|nr:glycosyltransferase family 2 protein [bacterium]
MTPKISFHFVSLIVPIYKQEKTIVKNLKQIIKVLNIIRYDYEVITVVDGKIDKSFDEIQRAKLKKVRCFAYEKNHGKSYAIRLGMNEAKGDYVMFLDSGMEINPNSISMLLEHMEWYDADIIVGSKRHLASQVQYPLSRQILSQGYYWLVKLLFGIKIHDTQAGIKVFRRHVLQAVLPRLVEKKFAGDLEILVVADSLGFDRIYEAPIKLDYRLSSISSASAVQSILNIFIDTLAIFYRSRILRYYNSHKKVFKYPKDLEIFKI